MTERLIIEGTAVYEIDEECLRRREEAEQERERKRLRSTDSEASDKDDS